jgi:hypothetical protein
MLARQITTRTDDGEISVDFVRADLVRAPKRKTNRPLTPTEEMELRDKVWVILANQGLTTHEIERACAKAAQSERNIRRRLGRFQEVQAQDPAEAN